MIAVNGIYVKQPTPQAGYSAEAFYQGMMEALLIAELW